MCRNSVAASKRTLSPELIDGDRGRVPRPKRDPGPGLFHVYTHCVWAAPGLFRSDVDRMAFLRQLARVIRGFGWTCIAYCLMDTHYHLIVDVPDPSLPLGMQSLNFRYAIGFNQTYGLRGHVLFERYGSRRIEGQADLLGTYKYVALNPVEANLCASPLDWVWSSYAGTVGRAAPQAFVEAALILGCMDGSRERRAAQLRRYVESS
jgi:putative transposase